MARKKNGVDGQPDEMLSAEEQARRDIQDAAAAASYQSAMPANGTADTAAPETANGVAAAAVAVRRHKSKRETFYLVIGTTKDGTCIDVLGRYETGNQARKAKEVMGMAVARAYGSTQVVQCRDRTNV